MWAVFPLLLLLSCQCYQAGTLMQKISVSGTAYIDEDKLLEYIDRQVAKEVKKANKDKGVGLKTDSDYVGCYHDDNSRLLKHKLKDSDDNSIENCRKRCKGFKYIGLQYNKQCFCGNTLDPDRYPLKPESECQMTCTGNPQQMCGGHYRNSIYHGTKGVGLNMESDYVGCYHDDNNRLFKHKLTDVHDNSIENCRKRCKGFQYVGLQYSKQCFCGNTLDPDRYPLKPESECRMTCRGNPQQMCGGSWRNSIYHGDYVGCYLDDGNRLLKHKVGKLQHNSLESCRKHCKGFKYLGLQYSYQCFCGNTLDHEKYSLKPERECKMTCTGNPQQKCGGSWRNSIYHV